MVTVGKYAICIVGALSALTGMILWLNLSQESAILMGIVLGFLTGQLIIAWTDS